MPNKIRFLLTVCLKILNLIFHNNVLIFECKYNLTIMQLRFRPRRRSSFINKSFIFKTILVVIVLFLTIFLLGKIDMPPPTKLIKQEISNDKFIILK